MVTCDTSKLEKQLQEFHAQAVKKMQQMVVMFSYEIAVEAIENTPFGTFNAMYELKSRLKYLPAEVGSAKGGWNISMGKAVSIINPSIDRADDEGAWNVKDRAWNAVRQYKLGDSIFITNAVPYVASEGFTRPWFGSLEGGYSPQAPEGIMKPTFGMIQSVFSKGASLVQYYNHKAI
jgi:hypothetical protein